MKKLIVIVGPTSSGKTSLAFDICTKTQLEIVSADSRQVVKEMDVGTGKVPLGANVKINKGEGYWEFNGKKIWGYDLVGMEEYFSAFDYTKWAHSKISNTEENTILVGGTGFYVDAVTGRVKLETFEPDPKFRKKMENIDLETLQSIANEKRLKFNNSDFYNRLRLIRAIEKENAVKNKKIEHLKIDADMKISYIGLTASREHLYERVDKWAEAIWSGGLLEETQKLMKKYPNSEKLKGLVYINAKEFLLEKGNRTEHLQKMKYALHAYIRRQQTWFKKNKAITWFDIEDKNYSTKVKEEVIEFLDP